MIPFPSPAEARSLAPAEARALRDKIGHGGNVELDALLKITVELKKLPKYWEPKTGKTVILKEMAIKLPGVSGICVS